jgi:hypothetical protein
VVRCTCLDVNFTPSVLGTMSHERSSSHGPYPQGADEEDLGDGRGPEDGAKMDIPFPGHYSLLLLQIIMTVRPQPSACHV